MTKLQDQLDQINGEDAKPCPAGTPRDQRARGSGALRSGGRGRGPCRLARKPRSLPYPTLRAASCAAPTCWPWGRWSSTSSVVAGALTASPSLSPGGISTPAVRKRSALLIGISPQTVRQNDFTAVQHGLPFPVLTDAGCRLAAQFGLAYAVAPSQQQYYRSILVNIPLVNGDASWRLPLPATYIVGKDGTDPVRGRVCRFPRPARTAGSAGYTLAVRALIVRNRTGLCDIEQPLHSLSGHLHKTQPASPGIRSSVWQGNCSSTS